MPILGIIASSITANAVPNSYESISTVTVGSGGASNVAFTSIPATYAHLQIRGIARTARGGGPGTTTLNFNFNGGGTYSDHQMFGNGSSTTWSSATSQSRITQNMLVPRSADGSGSEFGVFIIDILDYANTNKYKTVKTSSGLDLNGSGDVRFASGLYQSTSAISSIEFIEPNGPSNITQYSQFALYGIKGS
jgi:hypothetical protein